MSANRGLQQVVYPSRPPCAHRSCQIHKSGLNDFIRTTAATRGFKSDVNWDEYSDGLRQLATELEQLPSFVNAKGSKVLMYVDRRGAVLVPVHVRLKSAGGGGSTDEVVQTTLMYLDAGSSGGHHLL
ncbi:hypothetical protein E4U12_007146 [Claviceps purpurea]|nr:hypothetical protein E4U12_007146 [Claviceps purpurea]